MPYILGQQQQLLTSFQCVLDVNQIKMLWPAISQWSHTSFRQIEKSYKGTRIEWSAPIGLYLTSYATMFVAYK